MKSLQERLGSAPPVFDGRKADRCLEELRGGAEGAQLSAILNNASIVELLRSVFSNSPYLTRTIQRHPEWLPGLFANPPEQVFEEALNDLLTSIRSIETEVEILSILRLTKSRMALLIALCDISGVWPLFAVTRALSQLADCALQASLSFLLLKGHRTGSLRLVDVDNPQRDCGIFIIAMGKHGANELNYSSDIDVIVLYDRDKVPVSEADDPATSTVRLTKKLVRLMQDVTEDGYVFRTDLRLRPDAGATAVAISVIAAETYYESMGQNWERAAMIKARLAAGDLKVGERFLKTLEPFVFRKYLDYAAIEDVHSIKRQIHNVGKHRKIAVPNHNLKLGLGGIREIEFFVQTQQLIAGGRNPRLRDRMTCNVLDDLAAEGMITSEVAAELRESYIFLRTIEHRLQMVEDAQTHTLPKEKEELDRIARFSGYASTVDFERAVLMHLHRVNEHYLDLFSQEEALSGAEGSLVFTGVDDDPDTLKTLEGLGFNRPKDVAAAIRGWHFGRIRATRSARAREKLTKLMPVILEAISQTPDPDTTFSRFRDFLTGLPAGVQLFALFYSHAELLYLVIDALGVAPRLASYLAQNNAVLDALLDSDFLATLPDRDALKEELTERLRNHDGFEDAMDRARRWGKEHDFRIGLQVLRGLIESREAGNAYAALADTFIEHLTPIAEADVSAQHGVVPDSNFAVIGLGKLGGEELTATSDLDLILVNDFSDANASSNGERKIDATKYFTRVAQRTITALSAPTAEGTLYEVDMKLRPAGNAGPISTKFAYFERYYREEAWTWELMALTRARVIYATGDLKQQIEASIRAALCREWEPGKLRRDVFEMRDRIFREKGTEDPWDVKQVRGGLVDLEFVCQYLQLAHGYSKPDILRPNTVMALSGLVDHNCLLPDIGQRLIDSYRILQNISQIQRIAVAGPFRSQEVGQSLGKLLGQSIGKNSMEEVERTLRDTQSFVLDTFRSLIYDEENS